MTRAWSRTPPRIARLAPAALVLSAWIASAPAQNVLVVLLDDVGVDKVGAYEAYDGAGPTPVIDALVEQGVAFRNASAMPLCSATRASTLMGRLPGRTGVGDAVKWSGASGLFTPDPSATVSLPELLRRSGWATACIGKWHLSQSADPAPYLSPLEWGFDVHLGPIANISYDGGDYFDWTQNIAAGGVAIQEPVTGYATSRQVDDALAVMEAFGEQPWFVWLALTAPHKPLHVPPDHLHTQGDLEGASEPELYRAVLEAADTELGRLLDGIPPDVRSRTWVVVMGDNGTYGSAMEPPFGAFQHHKSHVYQGGSQVPLVVTGPGVVSGWSDALVSCTDLYATVAEWAGVGVPAGSAEDSLPFTRSLTDPDGPGLRRTQLVQTFWPNGFGSPSTWEVAGRDARYKFMKLKQPTSLGTPKGFYDLGEDPLELTNLVAGFGIPLSDAEEAALAKLKVVVAGAP